MNLFSELLNTNWEYWYWANLYELEDSDYLPSIEVSRPFVAISNFQIICMKNSGILPARADGYHMPAIGIAIEDGVPGVELKFLHEGPITNPVWNWTIGALLYLSSTNYGELTQTPPGNNIQVIGFALSADTVYLLGNTRIRNLIVTTTTTHTTTSTSTTTSTAP